MELNLSITYFDALISDFCLHCLLPFITFSYFIHSFIKLYLVWT